MAAIAIITPADIAKRAKARGGAELEEPAPKESAYSEVKRDAAEDLVSALGLKPDDVDMDGVLAALSDFHEACYGEEEQGETPAKEASEDTGN